MTNIYLVEISLLDDEEKDISTLKNELEDSLADAGFLWGYIDFKKAKIVEDCG